MIAAYFKNLGTFGILTQLLGFCAATVAFFSFQQKTQKNITLMQSLSSCLWMVHLFMLGSPSGALLNAVGMIRALVYAYRFEKKWARHPVWFVVFSLLCIGACALTYEKDGMKALFPLAAMLLTTFSLAIKNPFLARIVTFPNAPLWLVYNIINGSLAGIVTEIVNMISIIIGIIRIDIPTMKRIKKAKVKEKSEQREEKQEKIL